jgi:hypothetical protein
MNPKKKRLYELPRIQFGLRPSTWIHHLVSVLRSLEEIMKKLIGLLLLAACKPSDLVPQQPITTPVDQPPSASAQLKPVDPITPVTTTPLDLTLASNQRFVWDTTEASSNHGPLWTLSRDGLAQSMDYDDTYVYVTRTASNDSSRAACTVTYKLKIENGNATSMENICNTTCSNSWVDHHADGSTQSNNLACANSDFTSAIPFGMTIHDNAGTLDLTWTFPGSVHFPAPSTITEHYRRTP